MSLAINTIDTPIVFSSAITATTPPINAVDTATAVTTNYLNNIAIPRAGNNTITPTLRFTNNVVCNTISAILNGTLSFIGKISIGNALGTTTFYGTNPFIGDFIYWVQAGSVHRQVFCGEYTATSGTAILHPTGNTMGGLAFFTPTDNRAMGVSNLTTGSAQMRFSGGGTATGNAVFFGI